MNEKAKKGIYIAELVGILGLSLTLCHILKHSQEKDIVKDKGEIKPIEYNAYDSEGNKALLDENGKLKEVYRTPRFIHDFNERGVLTEYIEYYDYDSNAFIREEYTPEVMAKVNNVKGR